MYFKRILSTFLCLILTVSLTVLPVSAATYFEKLQELADIIRDNGLYSSDDDDPIANTLEQYFTEHPEAFDEVVEKMFQSNDQYSHYMAAETYSEAYPAATEYVGIGVGLNENRTDGHFIDTVFSGSPAEDAGLLPDDEIVSVNDVDVTTYSVSGLVTLIRGEAGTKVSVGIRRNNQPAVLTFTLTRQAIVMSNIEFEDMGDGVAYIKILRFGNLQTFFDFAEVYTQLPYKGFRSVILDVRDNPGGSLDVLLNILNYIVPDKDKEFFSIYGRNGSESYYSDGLGWRPNKTVVLVNQYTASAAEVLSGTLQDLDYADIVGTITYGKGVGQIHQSLSDGSVAIITTFEIKLPNQKSYNGTGITPDYVIELGTKPYPMPKLGTLPYNKSLYVGDISPSVLELEKRLSILGYFNGTPDETFDDRTLNAVHSFARDFGLRVIGCASGNLIYHLNNEMEKLALTSVTVDTQLDKAFSLAKLAAEKPLSYELPELKQ